MSDATTIDGTQTSGASAAPRDLAYLVVRHGDSTEVVDLHEGDEVVLGRSAEATVTLDDPRASREHARVGRSGGAIVLTDLGGRNGTRINGELIHGESRPLRSGDVVAIGHVEIVVAETTPAAALSERRLPGEVARLLADGGRATLLRVEAKSGRALAEASGGLLRSAVLVEAQADGPYACLFADADAAKRAADALVSAGVGVRVAALPADGADAGEAWRRLSGATSTSAPPEGVVVADASMFRVFDLARRVAAAPTTVLILGETGVGKEVVAEEIHRKSPRARGPFVRLNCGSLPETLLESELFGHEKGAFTGADRKKLGYLDAADGGTLFLDEIGELALPMQAKLLRVLESRRFMRVGGHEEIAVDVRIVAATNRDLAAESKAGRFREDLYFRLAAFTIEIPPLRDRPSEIALLAELFLRSFAERLGRPAPMISADAAALLRRHRWPGNVRELRNAMERALILVDEGVLRPAHLPDAVRAQAAPTPAPSGAIKEQMADLELRAIEAALAAENGNQTRAARRLGISRRALIYKLEKYQIGKKRSE